MIPVCVLCGHEPRFMVTSDKGYEPTCARHLPRVYLRAPKPRDFFPFRNEKLFHA